MAADQNTSDAEQRGVLLDRENPWPGLVSFTEANREFFVGREQEVADLARIVRQETLTVFFGKSGLGKSSLLRAGLAPLLREAEFVPIYIRLNHIEASLPLEDQVEIGIQEVLDTHQIDAPKPVREETLWEYFHKKGCDWWDRENRLVKPVLIFDQFEELLTAGQDNAVRAARTAAFLTELEDLVENRPPAALQKRFEAEKGLARQYDLDRVAYRVVLALREDFLADLEGLNERLRLIMLNRFRLLPMTGEQATQVVLRPGGDLVEEDVALRIVDFVSSSERSRLQANVSRGQIAKRSVEPALLSVVLQELNNRRIQTGRRQITADLVGEGQAAEILHDFFERGLAGMTESVRDFIVDSLLTSSGARNRIAEEDAFTRYGIHPAVIATLIDRRIIQRQSTGAVKWLELTHDSLADVVRQSRGEQQKHREIAAATAREAEVRKKLHHTRKLVAAFALLLIIAAAGLFYAWMKHRQLQAALEQNDKQRQELEQRNSDLSQERDRVSEKHTQLQSKAEQQAQESVILLRRELEDPTPGGAARAADYMARLDTDASQFATAGLKLNQARAAALAAQVFYNSGRISEGMAASEKVLALTSELEASGKQDPQLRAIRAAAHYGKGKGLLETGNFTDAEKELQYALSDAPSSTASGGPDQQEASETYVLAQIAISDLQTRKYLLEQSQSTLRQLLTWINARAADSSLHNATYWRAVALERLGLAQENEVDSLPYLADAQRALSDEEARYPDNLRLRRLAAELAFHQGFNMMDTAAFSDTARALRDAMGKAEALYNLDNENLDWCYMLGRCARGLGMLFQKGADNAEAHKSFQRMEQLARKIDAQQSSWAVNRYLLAISYYYLAKTAVGQDSAAVLKLYQKSQTLANEVVAHAPQNPDYLRSAALAAGDIGIFQSENTKNNELAAASFARGLELMNRIPASIRSRARFADVVWWFHELIGYYALADPGREQDAIRSYRSAIAILNDLLERSPNASRYSTTAAVYSLMGDAHLRMNNVDQGLQDQRKSAEVFEEGLKHYPEDFDLLRETARKYWYISTLAHKYQQEEQAVESFALAARTSHRAFELDPVSLELYRLLNSILGYGKTLEQGLWEARDASPQEDSQGRETFAGLADRVRDAIRAVNSNTLFRRGGSSGNEDANSLLAQNWPVEPLVPGPWRTLRPIEQQQEAKLLVAAGADRKIRTEDIVRIRALPAEFYANTTLYEAELRSENKSRGVLSYLRRNGKTTLLNGTSPPIHAFNAVAPPRLQTPSQAGAYLRFFSASVKGESGNFRIVEGLSGLNLSPEITRSEREKVQSAIEPFQVREASDGKWEARVTIRYRDAIFYSLMRVLPTGMVEMEADNPVVVNQPLISEDFVDGLRIPVAFDIKMQHAASSADTHGGAKEWPEAIKSIREAIDFAKESELPKSVQNDVLGSYYSDLSFYQLHAMDYEAALQSADEGLTFSKDPKLTARRSHALLLIGGHDDEVREIYRQNIRQKMGEQTWTAYVLDELAGLERDGSPASVTEKSRAWLDEFKQ